MTRAPDRADRLWAAQAADLRALAGRDRLRALAPRRGRDFASNDYLALSAAPELRDAVAQALARGVAVGSGGSRLLRGNDPEHEALETEAAAWTGAESALFVGSGYAANVALIATLPQRGDVVIHDALIHASMHEGLRLTRAHVQAAAHNDAQSYADACTRWRAGGHTGRIWLAVESLYSMDGDRAPLGELIAIAERHDAILIIDEAHATGVFGTHGRGLADGLDGRPDVVVLRTCGKALGAEGALICGPAVMRAMLVNRARPFVFSTAPSPLMAAAVRAAIGLARHGDARRAELRARLAEAERLLCPLGIAATDSPIVPVILGEDARAMAIAAALQDQGFDVRGIRPPTVPAGTARLRLSITLNATPADLADLAAALAPLLERTRS